jgi:hypothetical protein
MKIAILQEYVSLRDIDGEGIGKETARKTKT